MDLFKNPVDPFTSLPKNMDFLIKSMFFVVLSEICSEAEVSEQL
jgi:hypothetical protein